MSPFLVDSIGHNLGLGCPRRSKFFLLWTLDPLGPTWGAARSEKYLHPPGTPLEKNRQKIPILGINRPRDFVRPRWPSEVKNGFKHVLWTFNHLLWCLDDASYQVKKVVFALENWSQSDFFAYCIRQQITSNRPQTTGSGPQRLFFLSGCRADRACPISAR